MPSERYDVFVSYRWVPPDQDWVRERLFPALQSSGLRVLLDVEDFVPGRDLILEMSRAGRESRRVLCVLTPEYLEGNRMVSFESLSARRADPAGIESKLIPLIFRKVTLPDWMRGLIPVDWTEERYRRREWRKLLKVLEAPKQTIEFELTQTDEFFNESARAASRARSSVELTAVRQLVSKKGDGLGYELIIENLGSSPIFADTALIRGWRKVNSNGASYMLRRVVYAIDMDCSFAESDTPQNEATIQGETYEVDDEEWGTRSKGRFRFVQDTSLSEKVWEYSLAVPISLQIGATERITLRLLFRRKDRQVMEDYSDGQSLGEHTWGTTEEHEIVLSFGNENAVSAKIDWRFLALIANWSEPIESA
jgi:TIR domain